MIQHVIAIGSIKNLDTGLYFAINFVHPRQILYCPYQRKHSSWSKVLRKSIASLHRFTQDV